MVGSQTVEAGRAPIASRQPDGIDSDGKTKRSLIRHEELEGR